MLEKIVGSPPRFVVRLAHDDVQPDAERETPAFRIGRFLCCFKLLCDLTRRLFDGHLLDLDADAACLAVLILRFGRAAYATADVERDRVAQIGHRVDSELFEIFLAQLDAQAVGVRIGRAVDVVEVLAARHVDDVVAHVSLASLLREAPAEMR